MIQGEKKDGINDRSYFPSPSWELEPLSPSADRVPLLYLQLCLNVAQSVLHERVPCQKVPIIK